MINKNYIILQYSKMISHPDLKRNIPENKKQRLFRLFHLLIYQYKISPYFFCFLLLIDMMQVVYFAIHPSCCDIWTFQGIAVIQKIFGFLEGSLLWQIGPFYILIVFNCISIFIYGFALAIIIYQVKNGKPDQNAITTSFHEFRIKYLQYLAVCSRTVLTMPIISLFAVSVLNSKNFEKPSQICTLILAIVSFILYIGITYVFLQLFVDNSPFSKYSLAGSINSNQRYKLLVKGIIGIITPLLPGKCQETTKIVHLVFLIILMIAFWYLAYLNYSQPNLINNKVRFMYENSTVTLVSFYFIVLIQKLLTPGENITLVFAFIFCLLANFGWKRLKQERQDSLVFSVYKSLTTKNQILSYNYLMCQFIRDFSKDQTCLLKLQGILNDYIFSCKKLAEVCNCKNWRQKLKQFSYDQDVAQINQETKIWFQFLKQNLIYNTQKMNHLAQFHLLLSYIEKQIFGNSFVSYSNLQKCNLKNPNFSLQFLIYHQKRVIQRTLIQQDIKNNQKKQVDVNKYLIMSQQVQKFHQQILKSSLEHLQFWKKLSGKNKKSKSVIMKEGSNLLSTVKECQQMYKIINEKYPNNLESIVLFSNYSKYILNNHELILKNRSLFNLIKKKLCRSIKVSAQQQKEKYSENSITGSIIISGQKHNIGTIKTCSSKISKILKYASYELVGQNINTLMPNFIGNMHNQVLFKYLDQAEPQSNFVERYVPMIDKNNFMILARIMTKPIPSLINGLQIIGLIEKVKQHHIRHSNEIPKYMLYRCDTGNIEALSQSFLLYYGYRLMKVNQYSQISEQLSFNSIFNDIHDSDITNSEQGIQCQLKLKKGTKKAVRVKVYIRHQLIYFNIKIKLLYIFSCTESNYNTLMLQNAMTVNPVNTQVALSQKSQSQVNGQTPNSIEAAGNIKNKAEVLTEEQLKQLQNKVPFKYRILQGLLLTFSIFIIGLSVFQFYASLDKISVIRSFQQHNQYTSNSLLYLINIGYYARMMHISSIYQNSLPYFQQFKSNISVYTDSLQKSEFWLVNKQGSYNPILNFSFPDQATSWQISEKAVIYQSTSALSLAIFDLVTSSSSFGSSKPSNFIFPFSLTSDINSPKSNSYFVNLFRIRYSCLYELIGSKKSYSDKIVQAYNNKINKYYSYGYISISIALCLILIFLIVKLRILYILLTSIFSITSLFSWLTPHEIEKEVLRCQNFLQHFFLAYYEVVLRLKKNEILRGHSFQENEKTSNLNKINQRFMKTETYNMNDQNIKDEINELNMDQSSEKRLYEEEQEVHEEIDLVKISDKIIINQQNKQENAQQNVPLRIENQTETFQISSDQEEEGFQLSYLNAFVPITIGFLFLFTHFLGMFFFSTAYNVRAQVEISTQNLIYQNIEYLDIIKYYGLETIVDNSQFKSYNTLQQYFSEYSQKIYELQRSLSEFSDVQNYDYNIQKFISDYNINGVCGNNFTTSLSYQNQSFNAIECKQIYNGILNQGLRAAVVAYVENIKNVSKIKNITKFVESESFLKIIKLEKYIKSSMFDIVKTNKVNSNNDLDVQSKITIAQFSFFICLAIIVPFLVNWKTSQDLISRILGTYQIISLIPQRIFQKNTNLCTQYRKNVKKLLQ